MRSPPTKALTSKEKDLLWRYRYFLAGEEKALTFFLKCVDWENQGEVLQAVKLLGKWAPIQVDDALELLSSTFTHPQVRSHAVASLESASDSNLLLFLLQLVQALKYDFPGDEGGSSNLCCFLIKRSLRSHVFAVSFYWCSSLCIISSCIKGPSFAVFRCVHAQCRDKLTGKEGGEFAIRIYKNAPGTQSLLKDLCRQRKLISALKRLSLKLRDMRTSRPSKVFFLLFTSTVSCYLLRTRKVEKLRKSLLRSSGLLNFKGCSLPLSPELTVTGIESETADILKSVMQPLCLTFLTIHGCKYRIIFKSGDDLRQDQLTIQLFKLMDELLRKEQLDLKLTPYRVLATDVDTGMLLNPNKLILLNACFL
ncbi:hypothetical protein Zmor_008849 [Zophobas morio]|uniref:Uncharacterized protein n=1 Tax=Zophobas morio TaxID=2755281 RepID=A0AA38HJQ4_9CUCU|nr:hypothetical protein Zmor_008849 [Zophobas morio]